jgi:hypothetical protein
VTIQLLERPFGRETFAIHYMQRRLPELSLCDCPSFFSRMMTMTPAVHITRRQRRKRQSHGDRAVPIWDTPTACLLDVVAPRNEVRRRIFSSLDSPNADA